jgi:HD-like signal output (HDOD) protein
MMAEPAPTRTKPARDILAEIATKGDFPAAAQLIEGLREAVAKENCTALDVARVILKDPGLASKVLRLVNSAFYRKTGGSVSTITRAIIVLGFEAVRDLATGLLLVEELVRQSRSSEGLRDELRRSLLCGLVARRLSAEVGYPTSEEAYLLGLFANWGVLWLAAYYPAELEEARRLESDQGLSFEQAVERVCGITPAALAAAIVEHWNLPSSYTNYFRDPEPQDRRSLVGTAAKLAAIVHVASDYARTADSGPENAEPVLRRFQTLFGLGADEFVAVTRDAREGLREQARVLGIPVPPPVRTAARVEHPPKTETPAPPVAPAPPVEPEPEPAPPPVAAARPSLALVGDTRAALEIVAEIMRAIVEHDDINNVLSMVLEGVARAGGFDAVFLALLTVKRDRIVGRLGYGEGVEEYLSTLSVPLTPQGGVLAETVLSRTPRVVAEGSPALLVAPGAPRPRIPAATFVTHPITVRDRTVGVLVVTRAAGPPASADDLAIVQLFCNQASIALLQCAG